MPRYADQQAHDAIADARKQAVKQSSVRAVFVADTNRTAANRSQQTRAQLVGESGIPYGEIRLARQQQTIRIDVGGADGCPLPVHDGNLRVQITCLIFVNLDARGQQPVVERMRRVVLNPVLNLALQQQHDANTAFCGPDQDSPKSAPRQEVGIGYQSLAGDVYGVRWLPLYSLSRDGPAAMPAAGSPNSEVQPLYPEARQLGRGEHPFDVPFAYHRDSMLIEPAIYLSQLIRDFQVSGGRIAIREFQAREELMGLRENLLFNCTGLGAGKLFHDEELVPIRGQLSFLLPQPEVEYMTVGPGDIYMFPRHDGVLLGGSHERGVWSLEPDPATKDRILRESGALFAGMRG